MTESRPPEGNLSSEFRQLGRNLTEALRAAWEQPERKRLQQEIVNGLSEMQTTIQEAVKKFNESPTGQRLRSDADNVGQRVHSGEVESRVRTELVSALRMANEELTQVLERLQERQSPDLGGSGSTSERQPESQTGQPAQEPDVDRPATDQPDTWDELYPRSQGHKEVHPDDVSAPPSDTGHNEVHPDDVES